MLNLRLCICNYLNFINYNMMLRIVLSFYKSLCEHKSLLNIPLISSSTYILIFLQALIEGFLDFDRHLLSDKVMAILKVLADPNKGLYFLN